MSSAQFRVPADYASIGAALAAAAPVGGTVVLAPGVYREGVTIKVPAGVSLVGSSARECIIESDACTTLACADGVVLLAELSVQQVFLPASMCTRATLTSTCGGLYLLTYLR